MRANHPVFTGFFADFLASHTHRAPIFSAARAPARIVRFFCHKHERFLDFAFFDPRHRHRTFTRTRRRARRTAA
ncbi:hypothetical protein PSP6_390014 [Paraburkholderia tropica]|nr:hypothetical protein PSP6_390014 [Paraburkholderia tropica]